MDIGMLPGSLWHDWCHRREDGFWKWVWIDVKGTVRFYWQNRWLWKAMAIVPGWVKYWAVVLAATDGEQGNPGEVKAITMLDRIERRHGWWYRPKERVCSVHGTIDV